MPTSSKSDAVVHLHWVRESPERELVLPISSTLTSLDVLPPSARAAVAAAGRPEIELHLPPFRPWAHEDPGAWLAGLEFRFDAPNRLTGFHPADPDPISTMGLHQAVVVLFRAFFADTTPLTLVAEPAPPALIPAPPPPHPTVSPPPPPRPPPPRPPDPPANAPATIAASTAASPSPSRPPSAIPSSRLTSIPRRCSAGASASSPSSPGAPPRPRSAAPSTR